MRAIPLGLVIINALNGSLPDLNSCLSNFFYGSYGDHAIFSPGATCIHPHPTVSYWPREENRLVWVQKQAIEESLKNPLDGDLDDMLTRFTLLTPSTSQDVLSQSQSTYVVLHRTHASALLSVPLHAVHILPDHLPRFYRSMPLPINPLPYPPVSNPALERVKRLLAQLRFNPNVAALASNISIAQMRNDIRYLTGEDSRSPINSRHSFAEGSRVAAQWLKERFEETGAYCQLRSFLPGYAPNVIWSVTFFPPLPLSYLSECFHVVNTPARLTRLLPCLSPHTMTHVGPSARRVRRARTTTVQVWWVYSPSRARSGAVVYVLRVEWSCVRLLVKSKAYLVVVPEQVRLTFPPLVGR